MRDVNKPGGIDDPKGARRDMRRLRRQATHSGNDPQHSDNAPGDRAPLLKVGTRATARGQVSRCPVLGRTKMDNYGFPLCCLSR